MPSLSGIPERKEYFRLFHMVENKRNWRMPINTVVSLTDEEFLMMDTAIRFITGSREVHITPKDIPGQYQVLAEGYYNAGT